MTLEEALNGPCKPTVEDIIASMITEKLDKGVPPVYKRTVYVNSTTFVSTGIPCESTGASVMVKGSENHYSAIMHFQIRDGVGTKYTIYSGNGHSEDVGLKVEDGVIKVNAPDHTTGKHVTIMSIALETPE